MIPPRIPLELSALSKIYETPTGPFVALENVNLEVSDGEFVCLLGHSGCGKSTVLSICAGLQQATFGGVVIDGKEVDTPGTDRAVVFQAPCLLPWLTVHENVALAVRQAFPKLGSADRWVHVERYLELVGVADYADQRPAGLSLGTQQCVSLARALALEPRFLLLDEPFSMLDSLTRFELQDILLNVWEQSRKTVLMVTHDVDEAMYLADRLVLMTDGPAACVGDTVTLPFSRPRERAQVLEHPEYYDVHRRVIDFLDHHARQSRTEGSRPS